ncbi:MAG: nucleotidyltransferase family protein [Candidatus Nitrosocaldus sp.]|nr:nucleotidyltransferase family protein [Candidatus Nitrosocaldus sp.]MCS7141988.1 nucleotidyltransferase family protein [Candidatus Nitrosocaldus sp.]MDW8000663.1 nucleotidyltransferase family protein [Candidatus Nitrosocaldus sp.]MDW8276182.1 nucleotidyltransferase family protein [Candidatus Nitrosocaldus sp.]
MSGSVDVAVILAGGLGRRLHPLTLVMPKPMLPVGDKPLLEHTVEWLRSNGIEHIIICTSYLGRIIENYFGDGGMLGVRIEYARAGRPLGTGGQLKSAEPLLTNHDRFVCLYGDSLYEFNLSTMVGAHEARHGEDDSVVATMAVAQYTARLDYGFIDVDGSGRVVGWREKPEFRGLINIGCYVMERGILEFIPRDTVSSMNSVFMDAIARGKRIYVYEIDGRFRDIGNERAYMDAYREYSERLGDV